MSSERLIDDVILHALKDADQRKMKCFVNIREAEFSKLLFPNNMSLRDDSVAHLVAYFKPLMKCEKGRQQVLRSNTLESPFFEKGNNRYVSIPAVEYTGRPEKILIDPKLVELVRRQKRAHVNKTGEKRKEMDQDSAIAEVSSGTSAQT